MRSEQRFTKLTKPSGSLAEIRIRFYDFIVIKNIGKVTNTIQEIYKEEL